MKILLIYPLYKYEHAGKLAEPLGLLYIASTLRNNGNEVSFIDLTLQDSLECLDAEARNADVIGMGAATAIYGRTCEVLAHLKNLDLSAPVVLGGPHATIFPEKCVEDGFDFVVVGEGEQSIIKLLDAIEGKIELDEVDGIAYRDNEGKVRCNPGGSFIANIDDIPFPARDLIDYDAYFRNAMKYVGFITTRGCPHHCLFCKPMQNKLFGSKLRSRSVTNVVDEIEEIRNRLGPFQFMFRDDTLTALGPVWIAELGKQLNERGLNTEGWACHGRVTDMTEELVRELKRAGCKYISFGVESGSQRILDYYRKDIKVEDTIRAFDMCHKYGIRPRAFIMIGAPDETVEDMELTVKLLKRIKPFGSNLFITTPSPGTNLYNVMMREGLYNINDYEEADYSQTSLPIKLKGMKVEDLFRYQKKINRMRLKQVILNTLTNADEFKRVMRIIIHSRRDFWEILRSYLRTNALPSAE